MNFTKTLETLNAIKSAEIKISDTSKGEAIHQTQRNTISGLLRKALFDDLSQIFPISEDSNSIVAYLTADGVVLEVPNESVRDKLTSPIGSGAITLEIGFSVKNLEYNARDMSEDYAEQVAQKEAEKKEKAEKKARKIARDKALREEKAKAKAKP